MRTDNGVQVLGPGRLPPIVRNGSWVQWLHDESGSVICCTEPIREHWNVRAGDLVWIHISVSPVRGAIKAKLSGLPSIKSHWIGTRPEGRPDVWWWVTTQRGVVTLDELLRNQELAA